MAQSNSQGVDSRSRDISFYKLAKAINERKETIDPSFSLLRMKTFETSLTEDLPPKPFNILAAAFFLHSLNSGSTFFL